MEIKRGYVKWHDEDGVFHKELLTDHPDMLANATPEQQIAAEEAKRAIREPSDEQENEDLRDWDTLEDFRKSKAPTVEVMSGAEEENDGHSRMAEHDEDFQEAAR